MSNLTITWGISQHSSFIVQQRAAWTNEHSRRPTSIREKSKRMYLSLHSRDLIDIPTLAYFDLPLTLLSLSASYSLSNASPPNSHSSSPLYFHINKNLYSLSPSSGYPSSVITISSSSPSSTTLTSISLSLSFSPNCSAPLFQSIPVASPHRQWCNPPTPARNHRVWSRLASQAGASPHHTQ